MPVVGGPESIPGNSGSIDERSSIVGGRDRGDDLPVIEDDNTTGDSESHDTQTIVRRMAIHSSAIHLRYTKWTSRDAAAHIAVPKEDDDKYSRGVLGIITGSTEYPGAAVLGVEAALRTGVGMVRYLGPQRASDLVLARRPETVTANGRVQAWLIGSGMDAVIGGGESTAAMKDAVGQAVPIILDGGGLDLHSSAKGPTVITPHFRELARVIGGDVEAISKDPATAAAKAADMLGITVLLKGHTTYIAAPDGTRLMTNSGPTWLATAGSGDALGGVLGALVATHASEITADPGDLARLAATASVIHGLAGKRASKGGPITILDLTAALPAVIAGLLES
jgi:ADP-dependent NAD(P)H-hydrate dehydratase / NAD(P)H-hydrate epimerase